MHGSGILVISVRGLHDSKLDSMLHGKIETDALMSTLLFGGLGDLLCGNLYSSSKTTGRRRYHIETSEPKMRYSL